MTTNHIVSVPLNEELASLIGKKGSVNGLTYFNRKVGDDVIVVLYPTNAAEKPYGIAESMLVSGQIVISTAQVGKELGEALVAASLLDKKVLITDENDISKLIGNGLLKNYEIVGKDVLLEKLLQFKDERQSDTVRVDVDKAFPVSGIGTVVLCVVMSGVVKVHDTLHHSSGKEITVRSIQSQDVDVKEAGPGTRAGLAVKGMDHGEIEKGDVLASKKIEKARRITTSLRLSPVSGEKIQEGSTYLLVSNFSHTNVKVIAKPDGAEMALEKPLSLMPGDPFMLLRQNSPRIFASGVIRTVQQ